ncbi:MAG: hypothetical protein ACJ76F_10475 [Bacteroidia bacterium]
MLKNKRIKVFALVLLFLLLGYTRDFVFAHTNTVLYNKMHPDEKYPVPLIMSFLESFGYYTVYGLKWCFTAGFTLFFYLGQRAVLSLIFSEKKTVRWLLYFYLILLLLSAIAFGTGYVLGNLEKGYRFSRMFMGILQSPVPLMFLVPIGIFKNKFEKPTTKYEKGHTDL